MCAFFALPIVVRDPEERPQAPSGFQALAIVRSPVEGPRRADFIDSERARNVVRVESRGGEDHRIGKDGLEKSAIPGFPNGGPSYIQSSFAPRR